MHHNTIFSDVLVFKTNIQSARDLDSVALFLDLDQRIRKWNVDREDVDHVLRVESDDPNPEFVIAIVRHAGFACEELPD
jgi:hypothetical protein